MGKPSKLRNHFLMLFGVIQIVGKQRPIDVRLLRHQLDVTRDTFVLYRQMLAVFEHQVDEHPLNGAQLAIEVRSHALRYQRLSPDVAGKSLGGVAKDHSRELIE